MILSNRLSLRKLDITLCQLPLKQIHEIKDLGVSFNSKLNFSPHINNVISKAKQRIYLLNKSFLHCNEFFLVLAFKIYVIPILEYCSSVWSPSTVIDICRFESIQRKFTKSLATCHS